MAKTVWLHHHMFTFVIFFNVLNTEALIGCILYFSALQIFCHILTCFSLTSQTYLLSWILSFFSSFVLGCYIALLILILLILYFSIVLSLLLVYKTEHNFYGLFCYLRYCQSIRTTEMPSHIWDTSSIYIGFIFHLRVFFYFRQPLIKVYLMFLEGGSISVVSQCDLGHYIVTFLVI